MTNDSRIDAIMRTVKVLKTPKLLELEELSAAHQYNQNLSVEWLEQIIDKEARHFVLPTLTISQLAGQEVSPFIRSRLIFKINVHEGWAKHLYLHSLLDLPISEIELLEDITHKHAVWVCHSLTSGPSAADFHNFLHAEALEERRKLRFLNPMQGLSHSHSHIDAQFARDFVKEWIAAFNSHDIERIFALYDDEFEMTSPYIISRMGIYSGKLKGKEAIRPYWTQSLQSELPLRFKLLDMFTGVSSIVIYYESIGRNYVCETFYFNDAGLVTAGFSQHQLPQK